MTRKVEALSRPFLFFNKILYLCQHNNLRTLIIQLFMRHLLTAAALFAATLTSQALDPTGTLPVVYINTENHEDIVDKEKYLKAGLWIDADNIQGYESLGNSGNPVALQIKGRGNYSWVGFDKKPYRLKLDKKAAVLGMSKSRHFALLAHADDNRGFLRNASGLQLSRMLGMEWTPADDAVELVINNDYKGLYFLTELIKIDEKRVNIFEMEDNETADVTGGWLVEIDNYDTDPHVSITEGNGERIVFTYKSPEVLSSAQEEYLTSQMKNLNNLIYGDKNSDLLWQYMDLDQAARYYIVQEILDDVESYHGSCYLHKDRGTDTKWKFGPVWDFGNAFCRGKFDRFIWDRPLFSQTWIGEIYKFPAFQQKVKELWKEFCADGFKEFFDYLDNYTERYSAAAEMDFRRWPEYGNGNIAERLNGWKKDIKKKAQWLGEQWGTAPVFHYEPEIQVYLKGDFTSTIWDNSVPMTWNKEGYWTLNHITIPAGKEFKIASHDWKAIDFGARIDSDGSIEFNKEYSLVEHGKNFVAPDNFTNVTVKFDPTKKTLLFSNKSGVTEIEDQLDDTATIYTINGTIVNEMTEPGIYIVRTGTKTFKVIK